MSRQVQRNFPTSLPNMLEVLTATRWRSLYSQNSRDQISRNALASGSVAPSSAASSSAVSCELQEPCANAHRLIGRQGIYRRRSGVTLVEVLMSIGVFIIGLLGVLAVLPLAGRQSQEGLTADRAAEVGRNAYQTFLVRSMNDPTFWRKPSGASVPFDGTAKGTAAPLLDNAGKPFSYCIDPRFVAANGTSKFPFNAAAAVSMDRITLLNKPITDNTSAMMIKSMANNIFMSQDELVFDAPTDNLTPPKQLYTKDAAQTDDVRRATLGKVSWFATVVPKVNLSTGQADSYILSIIVINGRDGAMSTHPDNERVGRIIPANFHSKGRGGGDVTIQSADGSSLNNWDLNQDRWVMLAGNTAQGPIYRWYRILSAGEGGNVTLQGPDWPILAPDGTAGLIQGDTQVVMVTGTVTVFEKTIQLKASGL
jgi:type II secretory pathway pseudopilin PulG